MPQLFEIIANLKEYAEHSYAELPRYVKDCLNPRFELRPYQIDAFRHFITYFESDKLRRHPSQTLFHMATGSGKTLIMAGLILYLYDKGYRNVLFFVNSKNIIDKTRDNFLNAASLKYLFNDILNIEGENVQINEVDNFQVEESHGINICFATIQSLYSLLNDPRENSITFDDFSQRKTVLISDEAHHINVETKRGKLTREEQDEKLSWERCVSRVFSANNQNVLLEFTATCDLDDPNIQAKYSDKIIFDYPLSKFRADGYSKEVKVFQADLPVPARALLAVLLSQYRFKVFQQAKLKIKPVVLFKSATIKESEAFYANFQQALSALNSAGLKELEQSTDNSLMKTVFAWFRDSGITRPELISELKAEFGEDRSIVVNSKDDSEAKQLSVNSLESPSNPYRAVFAVDKLNEGWDVLNLFDIVRTYETRDAKAGKPGKTTIQEAQLIGRGARYCPFQLASEQNTYQRKFDHDIDNPLRVCETLYYHCVHNPRYVEELGVALRETGLFDENYREIEYVLKNDFKQTGFYQEGLVFANERRERSRTQVHALPDNVRCQPFDVRIATGQSHVDAPFEATDQLDRNGGNLRYERHRIRDISFPIVYTAIRQYPRYKFNTLKSYFPNLKTIREFMQSEDYLGGIVLNIQTAVPALTRQHLYLACCHVFGKIEKLIGSIESTWQGTLEFKAERVYRKFSNKKIHLDRTPEDAELGTPQSHSSGALRLDLPQRDWYVYQDCYGTSEEKRFLVYFDGVHAQLRETYDEIYLIRNERQLAIYSFDDGSRFEPDFLLILRKKGSGENEQYQIFVEPKGNHLLEKDAWKERFLLSLEEQAVPVTQFVDDEQYRIFGLPFFNQACRMPDFDEAMKGFAK